MKDKHLVQLLLRRRLLIGKMLYMCPLKKYISKIRGKENLFLEETVG